MAVKRCPSCEQSLPVACKSCTCGHIFITKKCTTSKDPSEGSKNDEAASIKRLRPERPKREIPDYEYCDDYTKISLNGETNQGKGFSKRMKYIEDCEDGDEMIDNDETSVDSLMEKPGFERSDSLDAKKKRGRPRGSRNKTKDDKEIDNMELELPKNRPRPKNSKTSKDGGINGKVKSKNTLPPIPPEKVLVYSIILSDINEKLVSQNKMKCLPKNSSP